MNNFTPCRGLANHTVRLIVNQDQQRGKPMIGTILTDAILRIEWEVKTNPEDYSDIDSELQELLQVVRRFRNFIENPTLAQLENLDSDAPEEVVIVREELLEE